MTAPAPPGPWLALAQDLLACLVAELAFTPAGPVCTAVVRHSATVAPADDCGCTCTDAAGAVTGRGQAWVRIAAATQPTMNRARGCPPVRWDVRYELGTRRCVESIDERGQAPAAAVLEAEAVWLEADARAARRAVQCCAATDERDLSALSQLPAGPAGGCAGWVTVFTTSMPGV